MLVLAVAGGAWALFGRDDTTTDPSAIGPKVPTSAPTRPAIGPVAPGKTAAAAVTPTSTKSVAATAAATATSSPAPSKAPAATAAPPSTAPPKAPIVGPAAPKPVVKPPVTGPQQGGTVAKKDYTFKVARGDTLWDLTEQVLTDTGRPTLNATVVAHLAKFYQLNQQVIGSDPNLIVPGQVLVWPAGL